MFKNLKLGTKIVWIVTTVVILGICLLATIIALQSSRILNTEADKMLQSSSHRYVNAVKGTTEGIHTSLNAAESTLKEIILGEDSVDEKTIEAILGGILDTNPWVDYIYFHLTDTSKLTHKNPKLFTKNNRFLILLHDTNARNKGGIEIVQADDNILNQRSVNIALHEQKEGVGRPQNFTINGKEILAYNMVIPFIHNNKTIGVIGVLAGLDSLQEFLTNPSRSVFKGDQRFLIAKDGFVATNQNKNIIGKKITEVNPHPSVNLLVDLQKNKTDALFDYTSISGKSNRAAITNFNLWNDSQDYWSIVTIAPIDSIQEPITKLIATIIIVSIFVVLAIALIIFAYIRKNISTRIVNLQNNLLYFFKFINHETKDTILSKDIKNNDELS
ncbi:TPA: cache domain-containing protein, partial [Campylobacter lari]|uniref:PDC sensor domain-containing protein n=1 Tax=Campylobacter sp. W0066.2 TaxID=2735752 RepID=UPI002985C6C8|nr:hypothetical protein [Campylobacter sp. W0066.2]HEG2582078.1 cache domain-containing protein [Campylobacter lari]